MHWSSGTGAHAVFAPISAAYDPLRGDSGRLGYPVGGRRATVDGGWTQDFHGRIHWSPRSGAHAVHGTFGLAYDRLAGESGVLGYPVGGQRATANGGSMQDFQHGRIHGVSHTGWHPVPAPIAGAYDATGGESGRLGYPRRAAERLADGSLRQLVERGSITYSPTTGIRVIG